MTIRLDHAQLTAYTDALSRRAEDLADVRAEVAAAVATLLAGWRGPAAERFVGLWEEWQAGAAEVAASLVADVAALRATGLDLLAADAGAAEHHDRVSGRLAGHLAGRLG